MATKMSSMRSESVVSGWRAPDGTRSYGSVTSTASSTSTRWSRSASSSAWRAVRPLFTAPRAWPTSLPAAALACGGRAPISRLASASGDVPPVWATLASWSASRESAAAKAASASSRMRSISSGFNASTSTGSYDLFGADISSRASDWLAEVPRLDLETLRLWFWDAKVPMAESNGVGVSECARGARSGSQVRYAGAATGNVNRNCAPPPGARPTSMAPPCASTMPLTM